MTYSINWPITVHSAVPFRSGNYIFPTVAWMTRRASGLYAVPRIAMVIVIVAVAF